MYETYEELLERKLEMLEDKRDRRQGSLIFDAIAPNAAESATFYADLTMLEDRTFADTASGDDLERRCEERGIYRKKAVKATFYGSFIDTEEKECEVPIGGRFAYESHYYKVIAQEDGRFVLEYEEAGEKGNYYLGEILPLSYMADLVEASLVELRTDGEDAEDDISLRKRYMASFSADAFGGNIADYKQKVMALQRVGGVKVYPVWNGGGTVRLVIIDRGLRSPTETELDEMQSQIDPNREGLGYGIAPIGHQVTVEAVAEAACEVSMQITLESGFTVEDVEAEIEKVISDYFHELCALWADSTQLIIRISHMESRILEITGILDITSCKINGGNTNKILGEDEIPKLSKLEVILNV